MRAEPASSAAVSRPLFETWPALRERVPWVPLGDFPTAVEPLARAASALGRPGAPFYVKRDDASSPVYGGNKVRTLEALFGRARAKGARRVYSTGAFGSNHALATVLHAPRAGLEAGVILFPQPRSHCALENLRAILARRPRVRALPHWSLLPLGIAMTELGERDAFVMVPGGATPEGALGYVSAALELARQVREGAMPAPHTILVGVGSTCTSAGLLVGLHAAAARGLGWREPPALVSVRVTPWPVTSKARIVGLARRTAALLASLTGEPDLAFSAARLASRLTVDGSQLGRGYGHPTPAGVEAIRLLRDSEGLEVDTTYAAKSMAAALARVRAGLPGPLLYWATKSTAPLPEVREEDWRWAPRGMTRWIEKAERDPRCARAEAARTSGGPSDEGSERSRCAIRRHRRSGSRASAATSPRARAVV
ncbi:MAG TPA: pyridoxal-phosphate dependent enzyme [Sandaracinaceae bacterium]